MFSQFFVQIFALYKFFCKNLRKKRRKFSMDPIWETGCVGAQERESNRGGKPHQYLQWSISSYCFAIIFIYSGHGFVMNAVI